ncbi:MAG: acetyl-CoA C-acetyltransferase [Hyphomicrobiaceae bacterium]
MVASLPSRIAIVGGLRIPFCRSHTAYADRTNLEMMTAVIDATAERYGLQGAHIDEVVGGAVVTHSKDWNLAREAVIGSRLAPSTPGITLIEACGTSLQAAFGIGAKIAIGQISSGIAVGSDTTSDAPIVFSRRFSKRLVEMSQKKSTWDKVKVFQGLSPSELAPQPPMTSEPRTGLSMGQHCELMAKHWGISRAAQDDLAFESHRKAAEAYASGFMDDLVVPFGGVFQDNTVRPDIARDKLASLKTVFDKSADGTLTAANSTPLTDGAAAVLLASEDWALRKGLAPQAFLTHFETAANDYVGGDGLLMAPTIAVARMLRRAGLTLQDFDYYEIHEAFAAQVLATLAAWEDGDYCRSKLGWDGPLGQLDRAKLNVKGSSIAFGHPFAATGARITAKAAKLVSGGGRCLISICTAGGMGVAAIVEGRGAAV